MTTESKIIVDHDGEEYPYWDSSDDGGYYYQISIEVDHDGSEVEARIVVMNGGCHIEFLSGEWLDTDLNPEKMFPNQARLTESDLLKIIQALQETGLRGRLYSPAEIDQAYSRYRKT